VHESESIDLARPLACLPACVPACHIGLFIGESNTRSFRLAFCVKEEEEEEDWDWRRVSQHPYLSTSPSHKPRHRKPRANSTILFSDGGGRREKNLAQVDLQKRRRRGEKLTLQVMPLFPRAPFRRAPDQRASCARGVGRRRREGVVLAPQSQRRRGSQPARSQNGQTHAGRGRRRGDDDDDDCDQRGPVTFYERLSGHFWRGLVNPVHSLN